MPDIVVEVDHDLHAALSKWASEQNRPLSALARDILAAGQHARDVYDPRMSQTTRWIRMDRDGGCGFCDRYEALFGAGKTEAPNYDLWER